MTHLKNTAILSQSFSKLKAMGRCPKPRIRHVAEGREKTPHPFARAYFFPLAVKAKASDKFFFGKATKKKPVGLDGFKSNSEF